MEVTLDLKPEAIRIAEELAAERSQSVAEFVSEAIMKERESRVPAVGEVVTDAYGWPVVRTGRPVTFDEARALMAEDED